MEVQFGPNSADEPNLLYKLQRKIKVFNTNNSLANRGYNLVACTSKYGIVFIASPNGMLSVYYLKELIDKESDAQHLLLKLQVSPTHIAVNCNQEWLAVIGGQMLLVYKCMDFQNPEIRPAVTIKCDVNPSTFVSSLQWNPCIPDTIGIVYFDGTLLVSQVSNMQVKKIQSNARCLCWSPKGKQLVTGNTDGTLTQYKPDLSQMKMVPTPRLFEGAPVEAMAIYWIATYQFAVTYKNAADNSRPAVTIVNTPKGGAPTCINYEDICYSMGSNRPWYYYLQGISHWNLILTSSSNSMEIATLATMDGSNWVQWCQSDEARPELPLTDKKQENYPVGICIDTAAIHQLPWGENQTLPPMPLLHVVSHTGWLSIFNVINLNKSAQQLCSPTQPLLLPNTALTSNIPDDVPAQPQQPPAPIAQPKQPPQMQAMQQQLQQPTVHQPQMQQQLKQPQPQQPALPLQPQIQQPTPIAPKPAPQTPNSAFQPASQPYGVKKETTPVTTETPTSMPQPKATVQVPKPQPVEVTAAMKLEQERISKAKANQELKKMLIKEVNDFQMELYNFMKMTQERQEKLQQELQSANLTTEIDMDAEKLRKECSMEDLRDTVIQLKLELVRTCAAVAEARAHAEAKDQREWTQMDPLTAKRIASVKKLSYYVQNQLDQAQKALDHKWNEMIARDEYSRPGDRMIRPILDDVYQPLVKQQEIIGRQQAMIKTLKNTMKECNIAPSFRSTSLLRNTPFKNKDPLSKLTKNILNMSIEPQNKAKEQLLSSQKLDALRDVLSNHKPIKIKPVSVEVTEHLENMKKKYEQSVRERELKEEALNASANEVKVPEINESPSFPQMPIRQEPKYVTPSFSQVVPQVTPNLLKNEGNAFKGPIGGIPTYGFTQPAVPEAKSDIVKESPIKTPSYNFKPAIPVARTLFADEPKEEKQVEVTPKPVPALQQPTAEQKMNASQNTKILLRQYILRDSNESASQNNDNKNDSNTFMGQNICSPTAFGIAKPQATAAPSAVFASKPITDMANMFSKFQTEEPVSTGSSKPPNDETGESETTGPKEKPITNMFSLKTSTPLVSKNQNVPDIIKGGQGFVFGKTDKGFVKTKAEENLEKSKENVPDKDGDNQKAVDKKEDLKLSVAPMTSKAPAQSVIIVDLKKPAAEAKIEKVPLSIFSSAPSSPPPTVSKPQQGFLAIATPTDSTKTTESTTTTDNKTNTTSPPKSPVSDEKNTTSITLTIPKPKETESAKDNKIDTQAENLSETKTPPVTSTSTSAPTSVESKPTVLTTPTPASSASQPAFSPNSSIFSPSFETQTTQGSIFGTQTQAQSIFTTQTPQATTTSVFGTSSAQSLFSAAASKSMFASTKSAFGTTTTTTQSSVFGSNPVFGTSQSTPSQVFGTSTQGSIFGNTTTTQASVFGNQTQTTQASVFGTQTSQASIFGSPTQTAPPSVFGSATSTTQASIFGSPTQTSPASVFGSQTQTTQASVFGTPTQTTQASVFGTPTQTTQASVFGTPTQTTQASIFGTPTQTTQASVFGTPTQSTQASVFGTPTQTTQASIFGTPTQTTQASVFGTPTTTVQSGSLFGGGETDLFASASISTTNAPTQASGGSIFGSSSGSVFGSSNTNVFGKASFTGSNPTASNIFGGGGATTFGQKPATDFWSGGNSNSGFGSTGFGQQPTTQSSSMFGTSGGSFSTPNAQPFGSPQPFGENKPSVFGSPQQQSAPPGFGGSPVFGSKPVFGGSPGFGQTAFGGFNKSPSSGFGAPASFGTGGFGTSAFGNTSPGKMFGNSTPNFGPSTQSNSTFETLATQNTLTFGNLAQQSGPPAPAAPAFNTSPSFTGWRG